MQPRNRGNRAVALFFVIVLLIVGLYLVRQVRDTNQQTNQQVPSAAPQSAKP